MKAKKWVLEREFNGEPTDEDIQLVEEELPDELQENGKFSLQFCVCVANYRH